MTHFHSQLVKVPLSKCPSTSATDARGTPLALLLDGAGTACQYLLLTCIMSLQNKLPFSQEVRFRQHSHLVRVRKRSWLTLTSLTYALVTVVYHVTHGTTWQNKSPVTFSFTRDTNTGCSPGCKSYVFVCGVKRHAKSLKCVIMTCGMILKYRTIYTNSEKLNPFSRWIWKQLSSIRLHHSAQRSSNIQVK